MATVILIREEPDNPEVLMNKVLTIITLGHGNYLTVLTKRLVGLSSTGWNVTTKVIAALKEYRESTLAELLVHVYGDVHESLHVVAERFLLAHLLKLKSDAKIGLHNDHWSLIGA